MPSKKIFNVILEQAKKKKRKVGISILKPSKPILDSLEKAKELADVVIYGSQVEGFECVAGDENQIGVQMVQDFKAGKIDQFVRGQVDDLGMVDEAKKLFDIDPSLRRLDAGLMEDAYGRQVFLAGASNPDLQTQEEKIRVSLGLSSWIEKTFGFKPKVAVMATCRPGSYGKDPAMSQTFDEAEATVLKLREEGYEAENVHIELEKAMEFADLIIPARGTIGNQIFRTLLYLGKGKMYSCPTIFPGKLIYEDNSRNEADYYAHIAAAVAYANNPIV